MCTRTIFFTENRASFVTVPEEFSKYTLSLFAAHLNGIKPSMIGQSFVDNLNWAMYLNQEHICIVIRY